MSTTALMSTQQSANVTSVNSKHDGNFLLSFFSFQLNNLLHLLNCKSAQVMAIAAWPFPSTFLHHVLRVFSRRAKKKMLGVYAARVVASVTHIHSSRDIRNVMFKGKYVRSNCLFVEPECAISSRSKRSSGPFPAFSRLVNVAKESLLCRHVRSCHVDLQKFTMPTL